MPRFARNFDLAPKKRSNRTWHDVFAHKLHEISDHLPTTLCFATNLWLFLHTNWPLSYSRTVFFTAPTMAAKNAQFLLCWWYSGMSYDEFSHVHHHLITQILRLGYSTLQIMVGWSLPSGKRLHNYGKSPFFMGKFIINYQWWFSIIMLNYQRVFIAWWHTKQCSPPRLNGWTNPGMWSPLADIRPYNVRGPKSP